MVAYILGALLESIFVSDKKKGKKTERFLLADLIALGLVIFIMYSLRK